MADSDQIWENSASNVKINWSFAYFGHTELELILYHIMFLSNLAILYRNTRVEMTSSTPA